MLCPSAYDGLGARQGGSRDILSTGFVASPQTSVFCECGRVCARPVSRRCASPVPEPILPPPTPTPPSPQWRGVCVCMSVCVRARTRGDNESALHTHPVPEDAAASAGFGTRAHTDGCASLQQRWSPGSANLPGSSSKPRGRAAECRASPHPGHPCPEPNRPPGGPSPRMPAARRGRRRRASGPEEQKRRRKLASPSSARRPPLARLPGPPLRAFSDPRFLRFAPEQAVKGKRVREARAIKKSPSLPAVSQIPGSCADYMTQGRRPRR